LEIALASTPPISKKLPAVAAAPREHAADLEKAARGRCGPDAKEPGFLGTCGSPQNAEYK
jgi:hypothetical protein